MENKKFYNEIDAMKKFHNCDMPTCKYYKNHHENCGESDTKCSNIDWCYYKALATYKTLYEESLERVRNEKEI